MIFPEARMRFSHLKIQIPLLLLVLLLLAGCVGTPRPANEARSEPPVPDAAPAPAAAQPGDISITEVMVRNHAALQDGDGEFPDWVELRNDTGTDLNLSGWSLSDRPNRDGLVFPAFLFPADSCFVVYASGKNRPEELHAPFSLSAGETLLLRDPAGNIIWELECPDLPADRSWAMREDGSYRECLYPTPWNENSTRAYDSLQDQLAVSGPVQLNEVMVSDPNDSFSPYAGSDWVELKNISSSPVSLEGWYLSDDDDNYLKAPLPSVTLAPGALTVIRCEEHGISLNSENEALFLYQRGEGLRDWLVLREIPLGGTFGRMPGRNGGFYFDKASPDRENSGGLRRVSATPEALFPDGFFEAGAEVVQDLKAEGRIYYTFDASLPTAESLPWAGPTAVPASCVLRAVAIEENALPSRALTLNYFIGEEHSLPVLSLGKSRSFRGTSPFMKKAAASPSPAGSACTVIPAC